VTEVIVCSIDLVVFWAHRDCLLLEFYLHQGDDAATTSVSGRADDLSYRCSSDTFNLDSRSFNISENWTVLSTEGDKPIPRFYVID